MNSRIESLSHGDGKVYLQMVLDRLSSGAEVLLDARLKDGTKIPAHLFPFVPLEASSLANYVVVLPHYDVREVDLTFVEYSGQGAPLSQSRLTVELNMVTWRSRFNALVHNELMEQMFDIEREYSANHMNIYFTDAIDDGDELVVKMLVDMPQVDRADVMVDFTDRFGKEIDLPVYPLIDEVVPPERYGDDERLRLGFSVRVTKEGSDFCATVYDANDLVAGGFAHFCDETYESLQEAFEDSMGDAQHDKRYEQWYRHHCNTLAELDLQRHKVFDVQPKISFVLPLFAEDMCYIPATLKALKQQTYQNFELVVVDCGVEEYAFAHAFQEWEGDPCFVHVAGDATFDDATARLTGMMTSCGDACAVLDPRVMLAPEALYEYVRCINEVHHDQAEKDSQAPSAESGMVCDVVYANHDYFDREEGFHFPVFKPDYSPDLLYSYFYMGPVVWVSRQIVDAIAHDGGFTTDAFDYDMVLKACTKAHTIKRIDRVLYHVQDAACISDQAQAVQARREEEAFRLGRKALALHLRRLHIDAVVLAELAQRVYRVQYRLPKERPTLSIIIPTKNEVELLDTCLSSVVEHDSLEATEIVVVDNGSTDAHTLAYYHQMTHDLPQVRMLAYDEPYNPAALANAAAKTCSSDYLLFLDNDTEVITPGAITSLLAHCQRPDVGVVGAKMLFSDDTIQHAGMMVGAYGSAGNIGVNLARSDAGYGKRLTVCSNLSAVSGAVMMVKRSVFEEVGGFDERFAVSCHDVDFCLKVRRAGYFVAFNGAVEFYHQENATAGHTLTHEQLLRAERERAFLHYRWPRYFIDGDPYMSAGFDAETPYFRLSAC